MTLARSQQEVSRVLTLARAAYGKGQFEYVLELLEKIDGSRRTDREYLLQRGAALARTKRREEAIEVFQSVLADSSDCYEALSWMAILTRDPRDMSTAIGYAKRAVDLNPFDASAYNALGSCYLAERSTAEAIDAFKRAVRLDADVAEYHHNLGQALLQAHRHVEAMDRLGEAIKRAPHAAPNYLALASIHTLHGRHGDAIDCLLRGAQNSPRSGALHAALASAFAALRNDEAAEYHFQLAIEYSGGFQGAYASWLINQGRFEEAGELFRYLIDEAVDPAYGYYGLTQFRKAGDEGSPSIEEMEACLEAGHLTASGEMYLHYALAKVSDQQKNFAAAMSHYDDANRLAHLLYQTGTPVTRQDYERAHDGGFALYERLVQSGTVGNVESAPILIVGMIRSGTTLLDQIVSSHAAVASAGELRFWIEEASRLGLQSELPSEATLTTLGEEYAAYLSLVAGSAERHTDKMPLNFANIGLIHRALPNAKVLHIRRHPVDTCLSIYTTFFGQTSPFAYDKANIVTFYQEYLRVMERWRSVLPASAFFELDYEDLIAAPEEVIPRVIEFCGLPWDEACLHHEQNTSAIQTPSRWQARQPIYKTSLARWKRYEPWLGEFAQLLPAASTD